VRLRAGKLPGKPYAIAATAANVKSMEPDHLPEKALKKDTGTERQEAKTVQEACRD